MPQRPLGLQDNPIHLSPSSALSALRPCGQRGSGELGVRAVNGLLEINSSYVRPRHHFRMADYPGVMVAMAVPIGSRARRWQGDVRCRVDPACDSLRRPRARDLDLTYPSAKYIVLQYVQP